VPVLIAAADRRLTEIDHALEDAGSGHGRVIVVSGAAGSGKSAFLSDTARGARSRGFDLIHVRGGAMRGKEAGTEIANALRPRVSDHSESIGNAPTKTALLIDDVHELDPATKGDVRQIAMRTASAHVLLVLTLKPYLLDDAGQVWLDDILVLDDPLTITLLPLDRAWADALIRHVLPDADDAFCETCTTLTGGNPYLLKELVTWISAHRLQPAGDAPLRALEPVPPRAMRRFVHRQLDELGPAAVSVGLALAFAERPLEIDKAARVAGLDRTAAVEAVDLLLESGIIAPGEQVWFSTPIAAKCLRCTARAADAARFRDRIGAPSDAAPGEQTSATPQPKPPTGDPHVVEHLIELADRQEAQGKTAAAGVLIERALEERVDDQQANARLLVRLGHLNLVHGQTESAGALATGLAGLELDRDRADGLLMLAVAQLENGSPRDAALAFDRASTLVEADDPIRTRAQTNSALADLLVVSRHDAAVARIAELRRIAERNGEPAAPELLLASAWTAFSQGADHREVAATVVAALDARGAEPASGGYFHTVAAATMALCDEFDWATELCERTMASAKAGGSVLAERNIGLAYATARFHRGDLAEAAETCARHIDSTQPRPLLSRGIAAAILADALRELDQPADAQAQIDIALVPAVSDLPRLLLLQAKARLCLRADDLADALGTLHEAEDIAVSLGVVNPAAVAWQPLAAVCYARTGDRRRAFELIEEATAVAERFGTPRARALVLRARALIEDPPDALSCLERGLRLLSFSPAALEHAKVLVQYGTALHHTGGSCSARAYLRRGIDLADQIGARRVAREGLASLIAAGGRPRRVRLSGPEALTPAERQVAKLAQGGATNREIAGQLVVTRKTVEWHLRKAFVKLGVSSREELSRVMTQR
jgi:DNA-binding CsgD family transcriptional regulator/tetratricopeptide (TPR) repeat protein